MKMRRRCGSVTATPGAFRCPAEATPPLLTGRNRGFRRNADMWVSGKAGIVPCAPAIMLSVRAMHHAGAACVSRAGHHQGVSPHGSQRSLYPARAPTRSAWSRSIATYPAARQGRDGRPRVRARAIRLLFVVDHSEVSGRTAEPARAFIDLHFGDLDAQQAGSSRGVRSSSGARAWSSGRGHLDHRRPRRKSHPAHGVPP